MKDSILIAFCTEDSIKALRKPQRAGFFVLNVTASQVAIFGVWTGASCSVGCGTSLT
jgi:hypothetical protein